MFFTGFINAFALEPVPITVSNKMNNVIFDGKWSFEYEWKPTSLNTYSYNDGTQIILRSAHQDNFVYILLDAITDQYPDKMKDYAIVCFDTKHDKSPIPKLDDYCFMSLLEGKEGITFQGNESSTHNDKFQKILNPTGFIGVSTTSDKNDRYTSIPHPSYEFRIPTDLIGRENIYGFYFSVHDEHSQKAYSYPENISVNSTVAPNPSVWGEIYSPDKSLPEFNFPMLAFSLSIILIVCVTYLEKRNNKII